MRQSVLNYLELRASASAAQVYFGLELHLITINFASWHILPFLRNHIDHANVDGDDFDDVVICRW